MYVLIDTTNYIAVATHKEPRALTALAYIQFANVDSVIMPCDTNRPYAQFDEKQLNNIYNGVIAAIDTPTQFSYTDTIMRVRKAIEAATHLRFPFSVEFVEAQAKRIKKNDDKPYVLSTDKDASGPTKAKKWHHDPQRNRARYAKPESPQNTARAYAWTQPDAVTTHKGEPVAIEHKTAPKLPPAPPVKSAYREQNAALVAALKAPPPLPPAGVGKTYSKPTPPPPAKPKAAPSEPAAPRQPRGNLQVKNGVHRPAAGGKTAAVWNIADRLLENKKAIFKADPKAFRKLVIAECGKAGVNGSTAATQYGHWATFNGVGKK